MARDVYFFLVSTVAVSCSSCCMAMAALRRCWAAHCRASSTGRTSWLLLEAASPANVEEEPTMSRLAPRPKDAGTPFGQAKEGGRCHGKARDRGEVNDEDEEAEDEDLGCCGGGSCDEPHLPVHHSQTKTWKSEEMESTLVVLTLF